MRRAIVVVALAAFASVAGAGEAVTLRFAWLRDTRIAVSANLLRSVTAGDQQHAELTTARYTLATSKKAGGLDVDVAEFALVDGGSQGRLPEPLARLAFAAEPTFRVDRKGGFRRLEAPELVRTALAADLATMSPGGKITLEAQLSDASLTAGAAAEWRMLVGAWVGRTLTPGQVLTTHSRVPLPQSPDQLVDTIVDTVLVGAVPCTPAGADLACVRLEMHERVDPASVAAVNIAPSGDGPVPSNLAVRYDTSLVTEPGTLLPHEFESRRRVSMTLTPDKGTPVQVEQIDVATRSYAVAVADR